MITKKALLRVGTFALALVFGVTMASAVVDPILGSAHVTSAGIIYFGPPTSPLVVARPGTCSAGQYVSGVDPASGLPTCASGVTSGHGFGYLDGNNAYSGNNTHTGSEDMSGATSVKVPTVATSTTGTTAASAGLVDAKVAAAAAANAPNIFSFNNLRIAPGGTPASQVTVSAGVLSIPGPSVGVIRSSVSNTCSTGSTGAGGLDVGTVGASLWYGVYEVDNGTTTSCLLSQAPNTSAPVTITVASPAVITWNSHGLQAGAPVVFATTGALPTGLTAGTTYYVVSAGLTTNAFEVAATQGGTAINTSGTQSGTQTASSMPALPSGYTYKARVGWTKTNASSQLIGVTQYGRRAQIIVDGTRLTSMVLVANSVNTSTAAMVSLGGAVPITASSVRLALVANSASASFTLASPNCNYSNTTGAATNPPALTNSTAISGSQSQGELNFETPQQLCISANTNGYVFALGWEDNL